MSRARAAQRAAPLPSTDLHQLRERVRALAENRPAIYRMSWFRGHPEALRRTTPYAHWS